MHDPERESVQPVTTSFRIPKLVYYASALLALCLLGGCAHHYTPTASVKLDKEVAFSATGAISLKNAQPSTAEALFLAAGFHKYYGNYNAWTDTVIEITKRELVKRGMAVKDGADKSLELTILSAKGEIGMWSNRSKVTLRAKTGDGYEKTYLGNCGSSLGLYRAVDGSLMRAVAEMLRDKKIVEYLKKR